ncbi:MAG: Rrf2 family transcriptional regulator [bacterium]|nr:Rrf2 family transcriptional regulator [bacterium]
MISRKTKYALQALGRMAASPAGEPMLIADLAARERIPRKYLETILVTLRKGGVLQSRVGRGGGYQLALPPAEITLARVVRLLEGEFAPLPCLADSEPVCCDECDDLATCGTRLVMADVKRAVTVTLENLTLADLAERSRAAAARQRGLVDFSI